MSQYKDQHEHWRPDYPPVWNGCCDTYTHDFANQPKGFDLISRNIKAFSVTKTIIYRSMKA